ncbi:sensor histidine kinase [Duganella sp. FT134W]|uniref:histidine kinase n=1 Tax=Duganella margarita TaxID=2692170 RepID=A0A7X4KIU3_9BURK|nr:sensor histidine kinase [Duganella margarita]MYM75009.1 sensor histidine kinase [Duganella margarita]
MIAPRLSDFIRDNIEPILQAWENFARTVEPPALTMDDEELRDHAHLMLIAFADDLDTPQSERQRVMKSEGMAERDEQDTAAETHAEARLLAGYTVVQLVSEYRALRSSVLSLWSKEASGHSNTAMHDMTRFNEAVDQALAESVARYERLVTQSRDMFLAILGHDLRNPLGVLVTGSSFIMQASEIPPKYVLASTRMFNSAKRMSALINDLIDFTRTHLGPGIPINAKRSDVVAICTQVIDELRTYHAERQIVFHAPPSLTASVDAGRIAQMLSNLIGNAIQHGSVDTPVIVALSGSDSEVVITVSNEGPVIPANKLRSIFEPLVRVGDGGDDPIERSSLGIGLFIAREIARGHHGDVNVDSVEGKGTRFTVVISR